ncbi:hypothetical protein VTL71DRAFT_13305 [Oculimacula yallundae]|uniref:Secreted protein n=1 Tax=Oculimacula yallundae TaxID=86028 RepID=A0ABR4CM99_9HELO
MPFSTIATFLVSVLVSTVVADDCLVGYAYCGLALIHKANIGGGSKLKQEPSHLHCNGAQYCSLHSSQRTPRIPTPSQHSSKRQIVYHPCRISTAAQTNESLESTENRGI